MAKILPLTSGPVTWKLLLGLVVKTPWQLALLILLFIASSLTTLVMPMMVGQIIDQASQGQLTAYPWAEIGLLAASVLVGALLTRAWTFQGQKMGVRLNRDLGVELVESSLTLDAQTLEEAGSGDLISRLTDDLDSIRQVLATGLPEFAYISVYTLITAVSIFAVNPVIGLVTVPMFLVMGLLLSLFLPRLGKLVARKLEAVSSYTVTATENLRGASTVAELGVHQARQQVLEEGIGRAYHLSDKVIRTKSIFWGLDAINSYMPLFLSIAWGSYAVGQGWASWGQVATASVMLFSMRINADIFTFWLIRLREMTVSMSRVFGVVDLARRQQAEKAGSGQAETLPTEKELQETGLIELEQVSYSYSSGQAVIQELSLSIGAQESLALVGRSGSGKTTLARLMAGSLSPQEGSIRVAGRPVGGGYYPTWLDDEGRPALLVCTQEAHLFVGSLAENLTVAAPQASDQQMLAALEAVGAHWTADLEEGLETQLGASGPELSRDQIQQLALARILLANPRAVILDESTTQLELADASTALGALMKGRAVIIISHDARIASLADRAILLEEGQIVAQGSPAQIFERA